MQVTYKIAMSAGKTVADRQMRAAGRTKWSRADYNLACKTVEKLLMTLDSNIAAAMIKATA